MRYVIRNKNTSISKFENFEAQKMILKLDLHRVRTATRKTIVNLKATIKKYAQHEQHKDDNVINVCDYVLEHIQKRLQFLEEKERVLMKCIQFLNALNVESEEMYELMNLMDIYAFGSDESLFDVEEQLASFNN